jgi:hypothetical protein
MGTNWTISAVMDKKTPQQTEQRQKREAEALRENLAKRKQQERQRQTPAKPERNEEAS